MMSHLVLFSLAEPDFLMAGAAAFAAICGIALMGGRSVIGRPLRMLANFCSRGVQQPHAVGSEYAAAHAVQQQDVPGIPQPLQRAA
jgi:hypothetical protein